MKRFIILSACAAILGVLPLKATATAEVPDLVTAGFFDNRWRLDR